MKIAINTRFLLKGKMEGFGWYTYEICKRLVKAHPYDQFYFFFDRPYYHDFIFGDNVEPVVLRPPARHPVLFYFWFEHAVRKALKKYSPDVFFSPDGFLCLNTSIPTFITIHDIAHVHYPEYVSLSMRKYYRHFMPKFVNKADGIFTVSQFSKEDIIKTYGANREKIKVFYNGCRPIFHPIDQAEKRLIKKQLTQGEDYFIYVGAIHPRKNIVNILEAFRHYRADGRPGKLVLTGRMAWKTKQIKKAIENSPFHKDIVHTGTVSEEKLVKLLGGSKALLYPSLFEGFGIPIVEAMRCGVPVITSDRSSMPEIGGDAVLFVNPESVPSIVEAMFAIDDDSDLVNDLLFKSSKQMIKFDWTNASEGIYSSFLDFFKNGGL